MCLNLAGSSVSSETLMRLTPQSASSCAYFASCEPLVVSVSSSSAPDFRCRERAAHQLHDVLAHQRLAAGQAQLPHALADEGRAQPVELLKRQEVALGQKFHVLGHAIGAAEVAAVGDRNAQIGDRAPERVDHAGRGCEGCVHVKAGFVLPHSISAARRYQCPIPNPGQANCACLRPRTR